MNNIFIHSLYILSGFCLFSSIHHGLIALRYPVERSNLMFSILGLALMFYVIAKAGAYQAGSVQELVLMRRWEGSFVTVFLGFLPWFLAEYTDVRIRWLLIATSILFAVIFTANLLLPYTIAYMDIPEVNLYTLPWGEQVTDLRILKQNIWYGATWLGLFTVFGYGFYSCVVLYRRSIRRKAFTLGLALGIFFAVVLINLLINLGLIDFVHMAEFGFLALIIVMSIGITRSLQTSEWRMRVLLDNVPAVIYAKDTHGRYQLINRRYEELFHISNEAAFGKTDYDLFPVAQAEAFRANDKQVLDSSMAMQFDEVTDINGVPHEYVTIKFPVVDPDGAPMGVCGISTDVTEQHKANKELNMLRRQVWHADRVLRTGIMTASLAHELSQPLAAILCNAQAGLRFLNRDTPDLEEIREILNDIARDDKRAAAIIKGLRAMLQQQETQREHMDLGDCISELLEMTHTEFIEHQIECESDIDPDCVILADRVQIQQVILNILINAMEAMKDQANIRHSINVSVTHLNDNEARVSVCDSGAGIPEDKLDRIFDGYYTTKDKGLGIGLAMCRAIMESHSGRIWMESNDGPGVTVTLALPLVVAGTRDNRMGKQDGSSIHA